MTFLFWNRSKIHAHLLPLKVRHRNLELELIYLNVYLDSCLFLGLNLIPIKHRHDISVLKSFNNRPAFIYFHSKCLTARLSFELYLCLFIYSFIHLFVFFFYYYLFVSLNLIYINQVWHFCFEIVQKHTPLLLPLKVRHRNLELWIDLFKCIFR